MLRFLKLSMPDGLEIGLRLGASERRVYRPQNGFSAWSRLNRSHDARNHLRGGAHLTITNAMDSPLLLHRRIFCGIKRLTGLSAIAPRGYG